jgi:hypothetical protein
MAGEGHEPPTTILANRETTMRTFAALVGVSLFLVGTVLCLGNMTGLYPTFPYAGFLTMTIGSALASLAPTSKQVPADSAPPAR